MTPPTSSIRVLAVDDDRSFVDLTAHRLELELDYESVDIVTETDARTALDRLDGDVDGIVSDYQMPAMDGLAFLDAVREHCPETPFILFTGRGSEEVATDAIAAGVTDYIQKGAGTEQYELLANRITNAVEQYRTRRELERNERRLKALFERSTDRISIVDADGRYMFVSPAAETLMNHDPDELVGESGFDYVHPANHAKTKAILEQAIDDPDGTYSAEYRYEDGEGSWRWVETRARNRLNDPAIEGIILNSRDITDRKRREQRVQAQQRRLDTVLSNVPVVLWEMDEDGILTEGVGQGIQKLGFRPGQFIGDSVFDAFADRPDIIDCCERALDGESITTTFEIDDVVVESWLEPLRDDNGDVAGVAGLVYDITERKHQERKHTQIIDRVTDAVVKVDEDWQFTMVDDRAETVLDTREQDLLGRELWDVFAEARNTRFGADFRRAMETRDVTSFETHASLFDRWLHVHVYPDHDGGLTFYFRDITDRKEYEKELERQNERLENFASIVSHDLRNPLSLAEGYLKVFRETDDEAVIDKMEDAHERMRTIINDVLTVVREGQAIADAAPVDFAALVDAAWNGVETADATLHTGELPDEVVGDDDRLRRVFENLFRNAVMHAGEDVTVSVGSLPDTNGVYVADDGPGIPASEREDVFEWGYSTTEDGTGYGLAIVNDLVEAHDWTVTVTDSDAGGARFEISGIGGSSSVQNSGSP